MKVKPEVLVGLGISGLIITVIECIQGTVKNIDILEDESLSKKDKVLKCLPSYIPAGLTAAGTIVCMVSSNNRHREIEAGMLGVCKFYQSYIQDYKSAVKETLTDEQVRQIDVVVADGLVEKYVQKDPAKVVMVDNFLKIPFEIDEVTYKEAIYGLNRKFASDGEVSLGYFYKLLGIEETTLANRFSWYIGYGELLEYTWIDTYLERVYDIHGNSYFILRYGSDPELDALW